MTPGQTLRVTVQAVNPSDTSVGGPSSGTTTITVIDPAGDDDGDGMNNASEDTAATNPFSSASILRITAITRIQPSSLSVTWSSVNGKTYQLESAPAPNGTYTSVGSPVTATATSTSQTISAPTPAFYRVRVIP